MSKKLRRDRHTVSLLTDHMVFSPKYRGKVLVGDVAMIAEGVIRKTCVELDIEIIDMAINLDHVHIFIIKDCVDETRETSDSLTPEQIKDFETMYDYITKMGLEENPPPLDLDTKPKNLLDRFIGYKGDILRFMYDFEVPFDNNLAERDVRMMKVQQKISGTFRSVQGARSFCRIRGYISTVKKNKLSVIDAIGAVFNEKPFVQFMVVSPIY